MHAIRGAFNALGHIKAAVSGHIVHCNKQSAEANYQLGVWFLILDGLGLLLQCASESAHMAGNSQAANAARTMQ